MRRAGLQIDRASLRRVIANIERRAQQMKRDAAGFIGERAHETLRDSQKEVPVSTGELVESGFVGPVETRPGTIEATIGYTAPHALAVHEDLTARHDDGKAKFLEDPVRREVPRFGRDLARAIKV